jgi:hypothetical protein
VNFFQSLNAGIFIATLGALFAGLFKVPTPIHERPISQWLYLAFFILLRFKICLDDHKYFGSTPTRNRHFKVGFFVGFLSWALWILAAYNVYILNESYFVLGWAIGVSTIWIVAVALREGGYEEQYYWMATNAVFVLLLWTLYRLSPAHPDDWVTWSITGFGILLVLIDFVCSSSMPELEN